MASSPEEAYREKYDGSSSADKGLSKQTDGIGEKEVLKSLPKGVDKEMWDDSPVNFSADWADAVAHGDRVASSDFMRNVVRSCNATIVEMNGIEADIAAQDSC